MIAAERAGVTVRFAEPTEADAGAARERGRGGRCPSARKWVAVTAASNAIGSVPDLAGIVAAAGRVGARVYVDAVHATPHRRLDLAALGADVIGCSAYKWFGPHVAMLCARPEILEEFHPDKLNPSPDEAPDRWELGTLPFESLAGVRAAAEYMLELDFDAVTAHEQSLLRSALDGLAAMDHVTLYGDAAERAPTLMFTVAGHHPTDVAQLPQRARDRGLGRQLLRLGARARPRPRPPRRHPRRLPALQRRGRRRAPPRRRRGARTLAKGPDPLS